MDQSHFDPRRAPTLFRKILIIMTVLFASVNGRANDGGHGTPALAPPTASGKYVKQWIAFPGLTLKNLASAEPEVKEIPKGRIQLVVFIASWCVPCQQIIDDFNKIEAKHHAKYTDMIYVFAHDTEADARAFAKFHKIADKSYLGTAKMLEDFHQPELPSVYASDRWGWLAYRKLNVKETDIAELDTFLTKHSSF